MRDTWYDHLDLCVICVLKCPLPCLLSAVVWGFFYSLVTLGCVLELIRQVFHIIACTVFFFYLQSVFECKNGTRFSNFLVMLSWF